MNPTNSDRPRRPPIVWAVGLSLALHVCLGLLLPGPPMPPPARAPLLARLAPPRNPTPPTTITAPSALGKHAPRVLAATRMPPAIAAPAVADEAPRTAPTAPSVDLDGALASARAIAREPQGRPAPPPAELPLTVERAVAKATQPDAVVESRGAEGEWVTRQGKTRCVARLQRKPFEEGVPMLPLCEIRKG